MHEIIKIYKITSSVSLIPEILLTIELRISAIMGARKLIIMRYIGAIINFLDLEEKSKLFSSFNPKTIPISRLMHINRSNDINKIKFLSLPPNANPANRKRKLGTKATM